MHNSIKDAFERDGYVSPISVISAEDALQHRHVLENAESQIGPLHYKFKVHTILRSPYELAVHPTMLDVAKSILGPNILAYNVSYIIKEPKTTSYVSWHQDLTYWGLSSDDQVSAWVALSPATGESGCMRMIPGSHKQGRLDHVSEKGGNNILLQNQVVTDVDESTAKLCELQPGEASFHHGWTLHASMPNNSNERRIGLNVQYIATHVRQTLNDNDSAMLVRGVDDYHYYENDQPPKTDLDSVALERRQFMEDRLATIYQDATDQ